LSATRAHPKFIRSVHLIQNCPGLFNRIPRHALRHQNGFRNP
jgi:hypothetical protein